MNRATILASTAGALMAACGHGGAQLAEPHPGVVPEPHPTPDTAPPAEPETTTTEATTTTAPPAMPPITVAAVAPPVTVAEATDGEWWEREALLNCIRSHEQGAAGYGTETGNGYHGGYQFDQDTWDGVVGRAGYPEWIGRRAGDAPSFVQDDAAWLLFLERGLSPWPTPQAVC